MRAKIRGAAEKPRLSIFKSNRYIYIQLIDDAAGRTLASVSMLNSKDSSEKIGKLIAEKAAEKGIKKAVFDRGSYKYHGRIKSVVETARKEGLQI